MRYLIISPKLCVLWNFYFRVVFYYYLNISHQFCQKTGRIYKNMAENHSIVICLLSPKAWRWQIIIKNFVRTLLLDQIIWTIILKDKGRMSCHLGLVDFRHFIILQFLTIQFFCWKHLVLWWLVIRIIKHTSSVKKTKWTIYFFFFNGISVYFTFSKSILLQIKCTDGWLNCLQSHFCPATKSNDPTFAVHLTHFSFPFVHSDRSISSWIQGSSASSFK